MYSTYQKLSTNTECEAEPSNRKKIIILGGGPNRIVKALNLIIAVVRQVRFKKAGLKQ